MMYVNCRTRSFKLYIDQYMPSFPIDSIIGIQADGDELQKCLEITGRPYVQRVMKFFDNDAKHIVGNW